MTTTSQIVVGVVLLLALVSCAGGPMLARASDVIQMKRSGVDDATLLKWVQDPARTFDLDEEDIADLADAGLSEQVMDAMLERSEEHHESEGSKQHGHHH